MGCFQVTACWDDISFHFAAWCRELRWSWSSRKMKQLEDKEPQKNHWEMDGVAGHMVLFSLLILIEDSEIKNSRICIVATRGKIHVSWHNSPRLHNMKMQMAGGKASLLTMQRSATLVCMTYLQRPYQDFDAQWNLNVWECNWLSYLKGTERSMKPWTRVLVHNQPSQPGVEKIRRPKAAWSTGKAMVNDQWRIPTSWQHSLLMVGQQAGLRLFVHSQNLPTLTHF